MLDLVNHVATGRNICLLQTIQHGLQLSGNNRSIEHIVTADISDLLGQFLISQNLLNRQLGSLADHPLAPTTSLHRSA